MPFLEGLNRFLKGKPVFTDPNAAEDVSAPTDAADAPSSGINKADQHSFPVVRVGRVTSHVNGSHLQVYGEIKNEWSEEIMLDKIRLLDAVRELDSYLRANEEREFLLYDGPSPTRQPYEAQLEYKTHKEDDYFQAIFDVGIEYNANDKTYSIDELRLRLPIRDING